MTRTSNEDILDEGTIVYYFQFGKKMNLKVSMSTLRSHLEPG